MFALFLRRFRLLLLASLLTGVSGVFAQTWNPEGAGQRVIAEAFGRLSGALAEAIGKGGPAKALSVCNEQAPEITREVAAVHEVILRRATSQPRNPKNAADDVEKAVLATFAAALAKTEVPKPQTITNDDGSVSFFAPIVLANPLCLQCHGTPEKDVAPDTLAAIQKLYPDDKATGFKLGDLRGLWRVTFPPKK